MVGWRLWSLACIGALAGLFGLTDIALAVILDVDTTTDSAAAGFQACTVAANDCSLRGAVIKVNALTEASTINLPAGTYTLTIAGRNEQNAATGDLDIKRNVTILGAGAATTIVQAGTSTATGIDRIFDVVVNNGNGHLTLRDVTVRNGNVPDGVGGGLRIDGSSTLERVHVDANQALGGGGLSISESTTIRDGTISGNIATSGAGGGGIGMQSGGIVLTVTNTTIFGNSATSGSGGGIGQTVAATTTLNNVTVVGNSATSNGRGLTGSSGTLTLSNSIVANNGGPSVPNCSADVVSGGNNLVFGGNDTCGMSTATGDVVNTADPLLGPLQNNAGPTPTMAPGAGSAAIDQGSGGTPGSGGACEAKDQRGVDRPQDGDGVGGSRCDIGAFEVTAAGVLVVDRTDDAAAATPCTAAANDCSLRGAVISANGSGGRITLPFGVYTLTIAGKNEDNAATGDLDIRHRITIVGGGPSGSVVQAGTSTAAGIDRVFEVIVNGGLGALTLRDVQVRNGKADAAGGGIAASGGLVLQRVALTNNQATSGGGLSATASLQLREILVSANQTTAGAGGGVLVGPGGTATLTNVTLTANTATGAGGGLMSNGTSTVLNNVTIARNEASQGGGLTLEAGTLQVQNAIVASNTGGGSQNCLQHQAISSLGNNLVFGGDTCNFVAAGDLQNQDPLLGPLQDNGGPTATIALGVGSPAIEAGNGAAPGSSASACASIDQRGLSRPFDADGNGVARCDIGAFEFRPITVDRIDDSASASDCTDAPNDCSLRGAILKANAVNARTVIALPAGAYTLTIAGRNEDLGATGDLDVARDVSIVGAGAATTIVQAGPSTANGIDRVFDVLFSGGLGRLELRDVTIRNGNSAGSNGGGILAGGPLVLERVHLDANHGFAGGGLALNSNSTILDSAISSNIATSPSGGGGIVVAAGGIVVNITNATIAGNNASTGPGGGITQATTATTNLNNVTVVGNSAANSGRGLSLAVGGMALRNTIVANNGAPNGPNCSGAIASGGNNLVFGGADTCRLGNPGDIVNTGDPKLGPLQNNGGPTPTMALGPNSAAIDAGNSGTPGSDGSTCAAKDQRGIDRLQDGDGVAGPRCDIGAFEARLTELCTPRPAVQVAALPGGQNGLSVTVTRGLGPLTELRFHGGPSAHVAAPNALVDIGGQVGRTVEFTFTPAAGAVSQAFVVRSSSSAAPTTLPLDVVDGCGVWSTLVGGGLGVVGVGSGGGGGSADGVGTFTLSPSAATNVVGAIVPVQFSWSVPAPSVWRSLASLELRLRDEQGVAWGVRWDELGDRFVVTDTRSPALFALVGARTQGSGPTGQSVTLTLPLQVLEAAAGGHFTIEVRATDDSGAVQGFDAAGALSIEALPPQVSENKEDSPRPLTEERRWQRTHSNAGSREDERIEGDVVGVDCAARPPVVTIGNRDGEVTVQLRGEAVGDCAQVQPGQYLEAGGEKIHERLFVADRISAE